MTIEKYSGIFKKTRQFLLNSVADLSTDQLNEIPPGFNNNIIWNLAHMVASQQGVCYSRGGLPTVVSAQFFIAYKPGSRPGNFVPAEEVVEIKELLFTTIDQMEKDFNDHLFDNNTAWTNRYGVEHTSIDDSIAFLLFHDGLHTGVINTMKKIVDVVSI